MNLIQRYEGRKIGSIVVIIAVLGIGINCIFSFVSRVSQYKYCNDATCIESDHLNYMMGNIKEKNIIELEEMLSQKTEKLDVDVNNTFMGMYINNDIDKKLREVMFNKSNLYMELSNIRNNILDKVKYFPIMYHEGEWNKKNFSYEDSWMAKRTYGGDRVHEGVDIMYNHNKADEVPIISIGNGIVEKKGWLNLGGYRLYVRLTDNVYVYYAHLSSYSDIKEGDKVYGGQILGYMGNTGYGNEGTKGKFDVHLHFGMYYKNKKGKEIPMNPYFLLKYLENNNLSYK